MSRARQREQLRARRFHKELKTRLLSHNTHTGRREENHFTLCRATTHTTWQIAKRVYRNKIFMCLRKTMENFPAVSSSLLNLFLTSDSELLILRFLLLRDYSLVRRQPTPMCCSLHINYKE